MSRLVAESILAMLGLVALMGSWLLGRIKLHREQWQKHES